MGPNESSTGAADDAGDDRVAATPPPPPTETPLRADDAIRAGITIRDRVVDDDTGEPVREFRVRAVPAARNQRDGLTFVGRSSPTGSFEIADVAPARLVVVARAPRDAAHSRSKAFRRARTP